MHKLREFFYKKIIFPIGRRFDGGSLDEHQRGVAVFAAHEMNHSIAGPDGFVNCNHCLHDVAVRDGLPKGEAFWLKYDAIETAARALARLDKKTGEPELDQPEVVNFLLHGANPPG